VSGAFAVGLFCAFVPIPLQMLLAAALAIPFRVNLPISVGLVWITNPVTMTPVFYFAYKLGAWVLQVPVRQVHFELTFTWFQEGLVAIWQPFLLGCFVLASLSSVAGFVFVRVFWRMHLLQYLKRRKERRKHPR
jgi:hypothetical protein